MSHENLQKPFWRELLPPVLAWLEFFHRYAHIPFFNILVVSALLWATMQGVIMQK